MLLSLEEMEEMRRVAAETYDEREMREFGRKLESLEKELEEMGTGTWRLSMKVRGVERVLGNVGRTKKMVRNLGEAKEELGRLEEALKKEELEKAARSVGFFREMENEGSMELVEEGVKMKTRNLEQETIRRVKMKFEQAISRGDNEEVSRYAKMLNPLGLENEAMNRYISFARHKFAEFCVPLVSEGGVMKMFLKVADTVEQHKEQIEKEFGEAKFVEFVRGIDEEADRQGAAMLEVLEKRLTKEKETRHVDGVLEELAGIFWRVTQYEEYMKKICGGERKELEKKMEKLIGVYISGERKCVEMSIEEACADDTVEEGNTSSMVEEVMYVVQKSMMRGIRTKDGNIACAVANNVVDCLSNEMKEAMETAANEAKIGFGNFCNNPKMVMTAVTTGKLQKTEDRKFSSSESFVHAVDNVAMTAKYCGNLKESVMEKFEGEFRGEKVREKFKHCVMGLEILKKELEEMHGNLCKLLLHFFKPGFLSPALMNLEKLNYDMNEAEFSETQINDPYVRGFLAGANVTMTFLKKFCLEITWQTVMFILIDQLANRLERLVLTSDKLRFSAYGALQFDNEVRAIVNFFTTQSEISVRNKFAKLTDISCVLNLESVDEFLELYGGRGKLRLTVEEIKTVLLLRLDFNRTKIEQIFR
jgi:hypothetical protein